MIRKILEEILNRKKLATVLVLASFLLISTIAFDALKDNTLANSADGCPQTPDSALEVTPTGDSDCWRDGIEVSGNQADAQVTNTGNSTKTVWLAVYESYVGRDDLSAYLEGQRLFPGTQRVDIPAGATRDLSIPLPSCNYQIDLFEGPNAPKSNPDFANLSGYTLLRWSGKHNLGLCQDTPPPPPEPVCDNPDAKRDLESATGVSYSNPMPPSLETIRKLGNTASVTVKNNSDVCSYELGLASYEVNKPFSPGTDPGNSEFINSQTLFDKDVPKTVGPGESKTFAVDVPSCAYQIDLFEGSNAPVPPDFAKLQRNGTHLLLDFLPFWKNDAGLPICGEINQCPVDFNEVVTITSPSSINTTSGGFVDYQITATGDGNISFDVSSLPSWLNFNDSTNKVTGNVPNDFSGNEDFMISAVAVDPGTSLQCGFGEKRVTIAAQCPVSPPVIGGDSFASGTVGVPFSYQYFVTGDTGLVSVNGNLPPGLTHNPQTRTIAGTPTQAGTFDVKLTASNQCGSAEVDLRITINNNQCVDFPPVTISGDTNVTYGVGEEINYTFNISGGDDNEVEVVGLPSWLTLSGNTITGEMRDETVNFEIIVIARESGTGIICDQEPLSATFSPRSDGGQCPADFDVPTLTSSKDLGEKKGGDQIDYLVTYTGDGDITVSMSDHPDWLEFDPDTNRVTGVVPIKGNYSFKINFVATEEEDIRCENSDVVMIGQPETGGRCLNCGGGNEPRVLASSQSFQPEGEVLESFVVLSQVPETGIGSTLESIIFIVGLLVLSALIAYFIMSGAMRRKVLSVFGGDEYMNTQIRDDMEENPYNESALDSTIDYPISNGQSFANRKMLDDSEINKRIEEIKTKNRNNSQAEGGTEDFSSHITDRLGDIAQKDRAAVSGQTRVNNEPSVELLQKIEAIAKDEGALISDEGTKLVAKAGNLSEEKSIAIVKQLITAADKWYEKEDGWNLLNKARIKEMLFATYLSMIPTFINWIADSNEKNIFSFLKMLKNQEHNVDEFIKHVVYEFDNLYRYRMGEEDLSSEIDGQILKATSNWSTDAVEGAIKTLMSALDASYKDKETAVKLAIMRVVSELG